MTVTHSEKCICCGESFGLIGQMRRTSIMRCPRADDWRKVIDSKMPSAKDANKAKEVMVTLKKMGISSSEYHLRCHEAGDSLEKKFVIIIDELKEALESLMKYEPVDGAVFHNREFACETCVREMRKTMYDGGIQVPQAKCPTCGAILVPIE